jgi:membrane fusion protein
MHRTNREVTKNGQLLLNFLGYGYTHRTQHQRRFTATAKISWILSELTFRPEALAAKSNLWLGSVRLTQPIGYALTGMVGLAVAAVLVLFGAFGTYTKKATVIGQLTPTGGALRITQASSGNLIEARVTEGDTVHAGDVLFVISSERETEVRGERRETQATIARELTRRGEIAARDAVLSAQRARERTASLTARVDAIDSEIASFTRDAELYAARQKIATEGLQRFEQLSATGFMSSAQTDAKREELLSLQAQQQALGRNKAALQRERTTLAAQIIEVRLQAQTEASELEKNRALLAQESAEHQARTQIIVTAPVAGTITAVAAQTGQNLAGGALLATLLPANAQGQANALEAHFYATTRQAGFVEKGQAVLLRYAAYPYQKFGMGNGEVIEVSRSPYVVQELPTHVAATLGALSQGGDPVYRVTVRIKNQAVLAYGQAHTLRAGMLAEADIVQDTRRLWEWALEPIFSVSGKLTALVRPEPAEGYAGMAPSPVAGEGWGEGVRAKVASITRQERKFFARSEPTFAVRAEPVEAPLPKSTAAIPAKIHTHS